MTRPLQRGSSTIRIPENGWSHDENPLILQANGKEAENCAQHGQNSIPSPYSLQLLMKQANQEYSSAGLFKPSHNPQQRCAENGFRNNPRTQDNAMSADVHSLKSVFVGGSQSDKSFLSHCLEFCSLRPQGSFPISFSASSSPVQNKRGLALPLGKFIMLCFVSIFVLIGVLGTSSASYSASSAPRFGIYKTYRRLQQEFSLDFSNGGIFGLGNVHPKDLGICPKDMEHLVPCYDVSSSLHAGFRDGEEYDRHCELSDRKKQCLIRPPKEYRMPLKWPHCKGAVWSGNVKVVQDQLLATGTRAERLMLGEDNLITFQSQDAQISDGAETHFQQIATMIGVHNDTSLNLAGIHTVLDIGCSFGSFGAHLLSRNLLTLCVAPYEAHNSQVQFALERGLPAMIGSLITRQLPYPRSSFNMIHCADCGINWSQKGGVLLMEVDRLLSPGGYFVWTSPLANPGKSLLSVEDQKKWKSVDELVKNLCWTSLSQQERTAVWRKTTDYTCYTSRGLNTTPNVCDDDEDSDPKVYQPLRPCIVGDPNREGISAQQQALWPDLPVSSSGFSNEELSDDSNIWSATVKNYWSMMTPLIFSDHPKRPAEDDPLPPPNMMRNIMDMNALYGGFNAALLRAGKSAWVMNVVPTSGSNTLPAIYKRGYVGALHNWCEAFPTYPRTYDLLHGVGLLSQEVERTDGCNLSNLFLEMDRILRPEGWVLLRDNAQVIEEARVAASQMRWEARVIEVEGDSDLRLLVCQKTFWKN